MRYLFLVITILFTINYCEYEEDVTFGYTVSGDGAATITYLNWNGEYRTFKSLYIPFKVSFFNINKNGEYFLHIKRVDLEGEERSEIKGDILMNDTVVQSITLSEDETEGEVSYKIEI